MYGKKHSMKTKGSKAKTYKKTGKKLSKYKGKK